MDFNLYRSDELYLFFSKMISKVNSSNLFFFFENKIDAVCAVNKKLQLNFFLFNHFPDTYQIISLKEIQFQKKDIPSVLDNEYAFQKILLRRNNNSNNLYQNLNKPLRKIFLFRDNISSEFDKEFIFLLDFFHNNSNLIHYQIATIIQIYKINLFNLYQFDLLSLIINSLYEKALLSEIKGNVVYRNLSDNKINFKDLKKIELLLSSNKGLIDSFNKFLFLNYKKTYNLIARRLIKNYINSQILCTNCINSFENQILKDPFETVRRGGLEQKSIYFVIGFLQLFISLNSYLKNNRLQCNQINCVDYPGSIAFLQLGDLSKIILKILEMKYPKKGESNFSYNIYFLIKTQFLDLQNLLQLLITINNFNKDRKLNLKLEKTLCLLKDFDNEVTWLCVENTSSSRNPTSDLIDLIKIQNKSLDIYRSKESNLTTQIDLNNNFLKNENYIKILSRIFNLEKQENNNLVYYKGDCLYHRTKTFIFEIVEECALCINATSTCGCTLKYLQYNPICTLHNHSILLKNKNNFSSFIFYYIALKYVDFITIGNYLSGIEYLTHREAVACCKFCKTQSIFIVLTQETKFNFRILCTKNAKCGKKIEVFLKETILKNHSKFYSLNFFNQLFAKADSSSFIEINKPFNFKKINNSTSYNQYENCKQENRLIQLIKQLPDKIKALAKSLYTMEFINKLKLFNDYNGNKEILKKHYIINSYTLLIEEEKSNSLVTAFNKKNKNLPDQEQLEKRYKKLIVEFIGFYLENFNHLSFNRLLKVLLKIERYKIEYREKEREIVIYIICTNRSVEEKHFMEIRLSPDYCSNCFLIECKICDEQYRKNSKILRSDFKRKSYLYRKLHYTLFNTYSIDNIAKYCKEHGKYAFRLEEEIFLKNEVSIDNLKLKISIFNTIYQLLKIYKKLSFFIMTSSQIKILSDCISNNDNKNCDIFEISHQFNFCDEEIKDEIKIKTICNFKKNMDLQLFLHEKYGINLF